ncbi:MAG: rhizopine-binding protein [Rhodovulum sulfidophilum]|uniref:Rhizopine-binding protein n=1 Tax=Rhodovulum sulfidophilum TaxID=35806 RepID=A0A2W5Q279_RHOSU|nr:MAG: rhizopine-binding protein [Rhodovulum sulfidophilum]
MRKILLSTALLALTSGMANAETIGLTMATFDDDYQSVMRNKILDYAGTLQGVDVQAEDAQNDIGRQLTQVENFIAAGVDAIMMTLVDTSSAPAITAAAKAAGVPLVYLNLEPTNLADLPEDQIYVGGNDVESGTLAAFEACRLLREQGKTEARGYIMIGNLSHEAALRRTKDVHDVIAMDMCQFITISQEQEAKWSRSEGQNLMTNWLTTGETFDVVFANNDEMAIGAIQAMKAAGLDMDTVIVTGVDATEEALTTMRAGDLDVTVFQNGGAIGITGLDSALKLARGESVPRITYIPFELVTPGTIAEFEGRN